MAKKAVLIGINRYRVPGADLRGCVPDVKNMSKVLQRQYGFDASDIHVLTDSRCHQERHRGRHHQFGPRRTTWRRAGSALLRSRLQCSRRQRRREPDNRDEILCPTDLDWHDPLRDDWLRGVFDYLKDGVSLTMISDSCHSGTVTRAIEPPDAPVIERYLPSPWDIVAVESRRSLRVQRGRTCTGPQWPSAEPATSSTSPTWRKS